MGVRRNGDRVEISKHRELHRAVRRKPVLLGTRKEQRDRHKRVHPIVARVGSARQPDRCARRKFLHAELGIPAAPAHVAAINSGVDAHMSAKDSAKHQTYRRGPSAAVRRPLDQGRIRQDEFRTIV